ncbi:MAG: chemotaxis protein CheW [Thermomonas sp.]
MSQIVLPQSPVLPADPPVDAYLDALLGLPPVPATSAQAAADAQPTHAAEAAEAAEAAAAAEAVESAEATRTREPGEEPEMTGEPVVAPAPEATGTSVVEAPAESDASPETGSTACPAAAGEAEAEVETEAETAPEPEPGTASEPEPQPTLQPAPAAVPYSPPLAVPSVRAAPPPIGQRWLRVAIGDDRYAVELLRVQEVVRLAPIIAVRGAPPSLLGVMNLRGRVVPVHDLGRWLRRQPAEIDERSRIVVLEHHDELAGLLVSAVTDVVTLDARQIEPPAASLRDRTSMGIARTPGAPPTVLLDATAVFD